MLKRGASKSYSVEPIYDPKQISAVNKQTESNGDHPSSGDIREDADKKQPLPDYAKLMEPAKVRKRRYFSLGVICFTAFILALSISIVMTSAKPYLDLMDPEAGTEFLGLYIASQPLAQLFFSPLMGFLGNRLGSIRIPAIISTLIMAVGFTFYACISALPEPRKWYLFAARFVIGAASGTSTLGYSYVASASTVKERTTALSLLQMSKSSAFIIGPLIQAAFASLGDGQDRPIGNDSHIYWNMYTAPAWLAVLLSLINIVVLMPFIFTEFYIAKEEGDYLAARGLKKSSPDDEEIVKKMKPDKVALVVCIVITATTQFNFNFIESTATLVVIEQLGVTPTRAVVLVGIMYSAAGVYGLFMFGLVGPISRKVGERIVLMVGILFAMSGVICVYPYGGPLPPLKFINETIDELTTVSLSKSWNLLESPSIEDDFPICYNATTALTDGAGCPVDIQPWCCEIPAIHSEQLIAGYLLIFTGVPIAIMMVNVIFSKVLGPYPQGTWTGLLGAGTAVARILCPLCVTSLYAAFGMLATCGFLTSVMVVVLVIFALSFRRLVPYRHAHS
ncbi:major facilitator superfamily domain-containing protein 8-like isoform X1 [Daphnia pulex]|uniref:major facilitator superfamily domain-containing protein 8-like isoform X1 n=2 Tax=Daphnia pulex TaxID=6669 RepID=UPI001EE07C90|nr:major facilitator superfamily domain-containing protein 8-like isoform X1 [Daphnia pulex]